MGETDSNQNSLLAISSASVKESAFPTAPPLAFPFWRLLQVYWHSIQIALNKQQPVKSQIHHKGAQT
jgi:hypothetical protein